MGFDFIVFGATGMQGRIASRDLLENSYSVLLCGRDKSQIESLLKKHKKASFQYVDLKNTDQISKAIEKSGADVAVNCAELTFNIPIMRACINTKRSVTDLGGLQHVTSKQFELFNEFKKAGVINVTGCGSTPGISNIMAAYGIRDLDSVNSIDLGFAWDSNIKKFVVPYSIQSIFDEFTEAPTVLINGKLKQSDRMVCQGTFDFKEIGKQTTYCIVHSEVYTFNKYFKDKGLKDVHYLAGFPDHSMNVLRVLMGLGFNSKEFVEINGVKISKLDFTTQVLKKVKIPRGYKEVENIWVKIVGKKGNKVVKRNFNCIVKTLKGWEEAGSNIDTGRTISIISQMLKKSLIKEKGVFAPEAVVPQEIFFKELAKRKMIVYENGRKIN